MKKLLALFTAHPAQNTVFQTSDGYNFFEESFADAHASSLKDKKVTPYTRAEVLENVEVETEELKDQQPAPNPNQEPAPVQEPSQEPAAPAQEPAPAVVHTPGQSEAPAPEPVQTPGQSEAPAPTTATTQTKKKKTTKTENQ